MAQTFDPYRALGLRRDATDAEVKAAHRRLAKRFHPDTASGDRDRFLRVQEAYRLLSDPLLRKEWDARHAPGPMRAERARPTTPRPRPTPRRPARTPQPPAAEPTAETGPAAAADPDAEPASRRPRSSRAYTWSASEVPWWEEGASENRRQPGRRRPRSAEPPPAGSGEGEAPLRDGGPDQAANPFDVYNRSSGAAWSMAARAYFRRGDQDLPRRGTFHYQGTQVLTAARARAAAAAAAQATPPPAARASPGVGSTATAASAAAAAPAHAHSAAGVARDAQQIQRMRQALRRRAEAAAWPSLRERLVYALLAWIPAAIVIGYGGAIATGCDRASVACPDNMETAQAVAIALSLGLLVALPKIAYLAALSTIGALLVGFFFVGVLAFAGVQPPLSAELRLVIGAVLVVAYAATALLTVIRDPRTRPWSRVLPR